VVVEGRPFEVEIGPDGSVWVNRRLCDVDLTQASEQASHSLLLDNRSYETRVRKCGDREWQVLVGGRPYQTILETATGSDEGRRCAGPEPAEPERMAPTSVGARVTAPLPGILVEVRVAGGDVVKKGDVVAVLESMKMHLELCAPCAGVVTELTAAPGREVDLGEVLAVLGPPQGGGAAAC
jgi:biotin carboxyl carrier protein